MSEEREEVRNQTYQDMEENTIRKLSWRMAQRNDTKVAKTIYEKREVDGIYNLEDSGLLDGFYEWLQEWKVIEILKKISPSGINRVMVPFFQFILLYFLKTLFGIESMNSLPHLLFSNSAAMNLVGPDCGPARLPLVSLSEEQVARLKHEFQAIGVFEWQR